MPPITFRNVARYVQDVEANLPLYQALGFEVVRQMGRDMAILKNEEGLQLVLHSWTDHQAASLDTALGFTITGSVEEARAYVEQAGFICLREPQADDAGFFYIYGDKDKNPINLVGRPRK
jgi:catechol 2,3-dioxygenase-like lactoylglutathione lyase family enzyme